MYGMKSTLIFLCAFTGVALAQLHHCNKYSDCPHLPCGTGSITVCKDTVCSCLSGCNEHIPCPCPLDKPFTATCWYGACTCRDSQGLISLKSCHQRSDCHSVTCPQGSVSHCINNACECQHV